MYRRFIIVTNHIVRILLYLLYVSFRARSTEVNILIAGIYLEMIVILKMKKK